MAFDNFSSNVYMHPTFGHTLAIFMQSCQLRKSLRFLLVGWTLVHDCINIGIVLLIKLIEFLFLLPITSITHFRLCAQVQNLQTFAPLPKLVVSHGKRRHQRNCRLFWSLNLPLYIVDAQLRRLVGGHNM